MFDYDGMTLDQYRASHVARAADGESRQLEEVVRQARAEERECGDCRLCCKVLKIEEGPEVITERGKWCQHASGSGCQLHAEGQPPVCARFLCAWRGGFLEDAERPDRLRAVPILQDGPPLGAVIVWHTAGDPELTKKALAASQRMLDGRDDALVDPLPQMVCPSGDRISLLVLPGNTVQDARGLPSAKALKRYNGAQLRRLAAAKALPDG